jgi:FkbH-like protein
MSVLDNTVSSAERTASAPVQSREVVNSTNHDVANLLADAISQNPSPIVDLWLSLHDSGTVPLGEADDTRDLIHKRYLVPLSRLLIGAFRGSGVHRAIYFDERSRYLPSALDAGARLKLLERNLGAERDAIARLYASDRLPPDAILSEYDALHADLIPRSKPKSAKRLRILFVGDCLFVETRAFLNQKARDLGIGFEIDHVFFNFFQGKFSVGDVVAAIKRSPPDLIGLSLCSYEALPLYVAFLKEAKSMGDAELDERARALTGILAEAVQAIRKATDAPILIHNACGLPLDRIRRRAPFMPPHSRAQRKALDRIAKYTAEVVSAHENLILVDENKLAEEAGGLRACGKSVFDRQDVPPAVFHTARFGSVLADAYAEAAEAYSLVGKAKAIFVDFDNTLWDGVMGEGPVTHRLDRQNLLKQLKNGGILLIALSKNEPASIRWSEMALTPDDFVLQKINWAPKPDNVSQAIAELDLAPSAFIILDDNPVERALVTEQVKGVAALDSTTAQAWRALEMWLSFPSTKQTEEARRRSELYREAAERRRTMNTAHDYGAMMRSLELRIGFRNATTSDMERLTELIQRTNQFNTTTRRRSVAEIEELLESKSHGVYVASLRDRFGKLGIVAVAVVERASEREAVFDSFIMSCRAMGFGLEQAFIRLVMDREPAENYVGLFIPTERNQPAASLYSGVGFHEAADPGRWLLKSGDKKPEVPDWFTVEG